MSPTLNLFNQINPDLIQLFIANGEIKQTKGDEPLQYLKLNEEFDFNSIFGNGDESTN